MQKRIPSSTTFPHPAQTVKFPFNASFTCGIGLPQSVQNALLTLTSPPQLLQVRTPLILWICSRQF